MLPPIPLRFVSLETLDNSDTLGTVYVTSGGIDEDESAIVQIFNKQKKVWELKSWSRSRMTLAWEFETAYAAVVRSLWPLYSYEPDDMMRRKGRKTEEGGAPCRWDGGVRISCLCHGAYGIGT